MKTKFYAATFLMAILPVSATNAFAHGETKPGPHGGYMRMPSNFHTEVVPNGNDEVSVFLVDISFQDPRVANSSVEASLRADGRSTKLQCFARKDSFACKLPSGSDLTQGELWITAKRGDSPTGQSVYSLPLSFEVASKP